MCPKVRLMSRFYFLTLLFEIDFYDISKCLNVSVDGFCCLTVPPLVEGGDEVLDYIVILQSPLELDCSATGTPSPTIT